MSFKLGDLVEVSHDNNNKGYDSFRGKKLKITHVATSEREHKYYDNSMKGLPLYNLYNVDDNIDVPCSLYEDELQGW